MGNCHSGYKQDSDYEMEPEAKRDHSDDKLQEPRIDSDNPTASTIDRMQSAKTESEEKTLASMCSKPATNSDEIRQEHEKDSAEKDSATASNSTIDGTQSATTESDDKSLTSSEPVGDDNDEILTQEHERDSATEKDNDAQSAAPINKSDSDSGRATAKQYRNILIVGKVGTGKATIANKIIGEDAFQIYESFGSMTKPIGSVYVTATKYTSNTSEPLEKDAHICYNIQLMNTVGIADTLTPEQILGYVDSFSRRFKGGIHLIIFVFKNARFTNEDKDAFDTFINCCSFSKDLSNISALFITCCETLNDTAQKKLVEEFGANRRTKKFAEFMKKGIYTVGFPNIEVVTAELKCFYEAVIEEGTKSLRDLITRCERPLFFECNYKPGPVTVPPSGAHSKAPPCSIL